VREGNKHRVTKAHKLNEMSSRSHAVFVLKLQLKKMDELPLFPQLYMIDLAGSENAKETGATGQLLVEAKHINQSLISLARVVSALVENRRKGKKLPVPFRESELTNLLRDVLSGDFVCTLILNASASPIFEQASLTAKTMAFGEGLKKIQVNAKRVQESKDTTVKNWLVGVWNSVSRKRPPPGIPANAPAGTVVSAERRAKELKEEEEREKKESEEAKRESSSSKSSGPPAAPTGTGAGTTPLGASMGLKSLKEMFEKGDLVRKKSSLEEKKQQQPNREGRRSWAQDLDTRESKEKFKERTERAERAEPREPLPHPSLDPLHPDNLPPHIRTRRQKLLESIRERRGRAQKRFIKI